MERLIINGRKRLEGHVTLSGAKNATLPIMAATLLNSDDNIILQAPALRDVNNMAKILTMLGAEVRWDDNGLNINTRNVTSFEIPDHLMREMRATVFLMGPLLGRFRQVRISYPGGCAIGPRPINWHIRTLEQMGANITEGHGYINAVADKLYGADIQLDFPSVGVTENIMMAAALAEGTTIVRNAAREPEIVDLQNFLNKMGAKVVGAGLDVIRIDGVKKMQGASHRVIPDRIEAGTFLIAGAITAGDIVIDNAVPEHLSSVTSKLREIGVEVIEGRDNIRVIGKKILRGADIKTLPHPGFPTDLQAPIISLLTIAKGSSVVIENVFENRFKYVDELRRMGADIKVEGRVAIVRGISSLTGAVVAATDLRAGAALVLTGLAADGETIVEHVSHIERGYENIDKKLRLIGADITLRTD